MKNQQNSNKPDSSRNPKSTPQKSDQSNKPASKNPSSTRTGEPPYADKQR